MLIWAAVAVAAMVFFSLILGILTRRARVVLNDLDGVVQRIARLRDRERGLGHEVLTTGQRRRQLPANGGGKRPNP